MKTLQSVLLSGLILQVFLLLISGCFSETIVDPPLEPVNANRVVDYAPDQSVATGGIFVAENIIGEPSGALSVVSLGYNPALTTTEGGSITVGLGTLNADHCVTDGLDEDFRVYENPFQFSDSHGPQIFTEAVYVEASQDGLTFYRYPATYPAADPALVGRSDQFSGLAGTSTEGNGFDLGVLITTHGLAGDFQACYLRFVDAGTTVPDYDLAGELSAASRDGSGADLESVEVTHSLPATGLTF